MISQTFTKTASLYRAAGWTAIASGVIGIITFSALITAVNVRNSQGMEGAAFVLFRTHDMGAVIQFVLIIPLAFALYKLSQQKPPEISRAMHNVGIVSLSFTVLLLLLILPKIVADPLYMFPQGVFGVWLIFVCWRMKNVLARGLSWFGIVVGFGLALVGLFPLGYAIFIDTVVLQIPAAPDAVIEKIPTDTPANNILHYILFTGTFLGIITLPILTILLGRRLLREKSF